MPPYLFSLTYLAIYFYDHDWDVFIYAHAFISDIFPSSTFGFDLFFCLHFSLCELSIFCRYTDTMGASKLVDHMRRFEEHYGVAFTPCQLLQDMAKANKKFYN